MHLHPKHNHPMQFSSCKKSKKEDHGTSPSSRHFTITGEISRRTKYTQDSANGAHSDSVVCFMLFLFHFYLLFLVVWFLIKCIFVVQDSLFFVIGSFLFILDI